MENTYHCYANRELSWLRFNERVLEEAEDSRLPLCERLSFLSIFQSNLDEFFMVRIGSLQDQMLLDKNARENKTNMTSGEQIDAALAFTHKLTARRDAAYNSLLEQLAEQGIRLLDFAHMEEESRAELEKLFRQDYLPLLSSFIVSKKQAFPFLKNKGIYAVAVLSTKAEKKKIGIVPCGNEIFPRLVPVPGRTGCFILSEELILHFLPLLYKGYKVTSKTLARITRNADIDADLIYDEDLNYRDHMAEVVKKRKKLAPVRLELSREIDEEIIQSLCKNLKLDPKRVFEYDSPLDHSFLFQIEDQLRSHTDLFFAPRHPQPSPALDERKPIIPQILEEDKLLHYPYESIRPFLQLLHEAACDPDVVSIKMTLYRLANHSKVVDALVEAAENGKQVDVLVELKARFDEENNIEWSRLLERAGCHVVYGIEGLKVHSKLCLITRKTKDGISFITQIGTGNYNEKTSELYTDYSFITADEGIGEEASKVFRNLAVQQLTEESDRMLVAPLRFKSVLLDEMDHVIAAARMGRPASMILKNNSISDRDIILKLQEASCAGVRIDMIVRGICCVRAEVPGKTENLHIRSLVGRYLEHGRIYSFFDGVHTRIYIASGDFLTRNTECRVEVGVRVEDPVLVKKLTDILQLQLRDNVNAREMRPDGSYQKVKPAEGEPIVNGQMGMYDLLRNDWTLEEPWKRTAEAQPASGHPAEAPAAEKQPVTDAPKAGAPQPAKPAQEPAPKPLDQKEVTVTVPDDPSAPEQISAEPIPGPKEDTAYYDTLEQMLGSKPRPAQAAPKAQPTAPAHPAAKPTVVVTTPKKRGLFSQVLDLFKKRK